MRLAGSSCCRFVAGCMFAYVFRFDPRGGPRVGAQTAQLEAPPTKDGVEGEIVDRPSQASAPVTPMRADDPRILEAAAKNAAAPGPATKTGPGEVPAVAPKALPVGTPAAMDLVGNGNPVAATAKEKDPVVEPGEIRIPAPPDDAKIEAKTKAKRKKPDEKTSKRTERTATASKFTNADGSATVAIGGGGSAIDATGQVTDEDPAFVSDGKGRLKKSAGVVRANVPEVLTEGAEVVSIGVPGARIGFGVRRSSNAISATNSTTSSTTAPTTTTTAAAGPAGSSTTIAGAGSTTSISPQQPQRHESQLLQSQR
jgi:hypothetical protein